MSQNAAQSASAPTTTPLSDGTDVASLLTSIHLIWIAILAALVIAGIVYGSRLKRRRTTAERRMREHADEAGVEAAPPSEAATEPVPATAASPAAPIDGAAASGPVTQLKGLGPKVAARLAELGVTTVGQLAALDDDGARALDDQLGAFRGRLERDRWIEQARFLAAGDVKGFEAVFGRLEVATIIR